MFQRILRFFSFNNTQLLLKRNQNAVTKENYRMIRVCSTLIEIVILIVTIVSFFIESWKPLLPTFYVFLVVNSVFLFIVYCIVSKHPGGVPAASAFMFLMMLSSGCWQALLNVRFGGTMTAYVSAVLIFPLLVLIHPVIILFVLTISCAVFCFGSWVLLPYEDAVTAIVNSLLVTFFGMLMGMYFFDIRLRSMDNQRMLLYERDHDALTGLYNRRKLFEVFSAAGKNLSAGFGMMMFDVDFFKSYNDTLGHQAGDLCLMQIGHILSDFARRKNMQVFRFGGEEFLLVCFDCTADSVAADARELCRTVMLAGIPHPASAAGCVTASIGCVHADTCIERGTDAVLGAADTALYEAKRAGRNTVCIYSHGVSV